MELSNLDFFLEWNELKALLGKLKKQGFAVHDIQPSGTSVSVEGKASVIGCSIVWSVCVEPTSSGDGRRFVFIVKSIRLKPFARSRFKVFKTINITAPRSLIVRMVVKTCSKRFDGLWAKGSCLLVDPASLLSSLLGKTDPPVQIGKIKYFGSDDVGVRLVIDGA